jgi:hypothetical protein
MKSATESWVLIEKNKNIEVVLSTTSDGNG